MKIDILLSRLTIMIGTLVKQLRGHIHEQLERIEDKSVNRPEKSKIKVKGWSHATVKETNKNWHSHKTILTCSSESLNSCRAIGT